MTSPDAATRAPVPIDCDTAVRRLWDYLDGRLPGVAHDEVAAHLAVCALCPPHFAFAQAMQRALATSEPPLDDDAVARLRARVHDTLGRDASAG